MCLCKAKAELEGAPGFLPKSRAEILLKFYHSPAKAYIRLVYGAFGAGKKGPKKHPVADMPVLSGVSATFFCVKLLQ